MKLSYSNKSDSELIEKYKSSQNPIHLATLFERYYHLVYGTCLKYVGQPDDARDVCMEIYELLSTKLLEHEITYYKSWLYRVTYNQSIQFLRRKNKTNEILKEYRLDQEENMEFNLFNHPTINQELLVIHLENCMANLKEEQNRSLKLFYFDQKCYNEIVSITGYALKKVKSYIQNGKRNLKKCIESKSE